MYNPLGERCDERDGGLRPWAEPWAISDTRRMGDFSTKMMKRGKRICRRHVDLVSGVPCDHASDHHAVILIIIIIIITITTDNQKCVILNNEKHFWWNSLCVTSSVAKPCTLHTQKVMGLSTNLNSWLVVWNMAFIFPFSWEFHHPNWRTYIFQRGWSTTNQ